MTDRDEEASGAAGSARLEPLLAELRAFTTEQWTQVRVRGSELRKQGQTEAVERLKPSAAQHSHVQKAVRDGLAPSFDVIRSAGHRPLSLLLTATDRAALAVLLRESISEQDFDLIVGPFLAAGLPPEALAGPAR